MVKKKHLKRKVLVVKSTWQQNTLRTRVKQIRSPQKETCGGFFMLIIKNARKKNKI